MGTRGSSQWNSVILGARRKKGKSKMAFTGNCEAQSDISRRLKDSVAQEEGKRAGGGGEPGGEGDPGGGRVKYIKPALTVHQSKPRRKFTAIRHILRSDRTNVE